MNKISKLIASFIVILFACVAVTAQDTKKMYIMSGGKAVYESVVSEIDSIIFYNPIPATIPVTGVSFDKTTNSILTGANFTLMATVSPGNATDKSLTWSSSNTGVATVNGSGVVTAGNTAGSAVITATSNSNPSAKASCTVTVSVPVVGVTGVSLDKTTHSIFTGTTFTLVATVSPDNATDKSLTWSSNNTSVATVNSSGVVTAGNTAGSAVITATSNANSSAKASCTVTVSTPSTKTLSLNYSSTSSGDTPTGNNNVTINGNVWLFIRDAGTTVSRLECTLSSSDPTVATIDIYGKITGLKAGTTTIKAIRDGGPNNAGLKDGATGTISLTVGGSTQLATFKLVIGESANAPYTPLITGAVAPGKTVYLGIDNNGSWVSRAESTLTSSNTNVATIAADGKITTIANGTTTIKAVHATGSGETTLTVSGNTTPATQVTSTCYVDRAPNFKGSMWQTGLVNGKLELTGTFTSGTYTSEEFATVQFTKLVGSWSVSHVNVSGSTVEVEFRVKNTAGTWSSWLSYKQWGFRRGANTSCTVTDTGNTKANASGGAASISDDEISGGTFATFQYRVTLRRASGSTASPKVKAISATLYRSSGDTFSAPSAAKTWPITGSNILRQQDVPSIGGSICSPTCVTMLMVHKGITDFGGCTYKHEFTARKIVWDGGMYGNWSFCCSAMGSWGTTDYVAYARHIYSSNEIAQLLTKGPIAASVSGNSAAGALKDINGTTQYSGAGHLIVVRGFEMSGGAVTNFLISDPNTGEGNQDYKVTAANLLKCIVSKIVYVLE